MNAAGIPSAALLGRSVVDGRQGLVLEHVRGPTLLAERGAVRGLARTLARLQLDLHRISWPRCRPGARS